MAVTLQADAQHAYEIVSFKYKSDVPFTTQQQSTEQLNEIASRFEGFVSRDFYYSAEADRWFDFIVWESLENAKTASEQVMQNPEALKVFELMDQDSMLFSHYQRLGGVGHH